MKRRSLFWKIFLYFWVSMMLFGIFSALIDAKIRQTERNSPYPPVSVIIKHSYQLIKEDSGKEVLKKWLADSQDRIQSNTVYILDAVGQDLLNRPLSQEIRQALQDYPLEPEEFDPYLQRPNPLFFEPQPKYTDETPPLPGPEIFVIKLAAGSGEPYTLIIDNKANRKNWIFWRSVSIVTRITLAVVLSAFICSFLARYLTIPLQKLRLATHRVASGNFDRSIDQKLIKRHDEIGDLARDFNHMAKQIARALQSQQRLLRDVSHELRSPLARLQIASGLAAQHTNGEMSQELQQIDKEVERLNSLISQSLSLARISNQTELTGQCDIDLKALLEELIETVRYEAQDKPCQIIATQLDDCVIRGNKALLYSGLENIVRNAVKHTLPETAIEIALITSFGKPAAATLTVQDNGPGVPNELLAELFTPFFQVDEARNQQQEGFGIGLAIAERAIKLHGGHINISNRPDGGLEVKIQLPVIVNQKPLQGIGSGLI